MSTAKHEENYYQQTVQGVRFEPLVLAGIQILDNLCVLIAHVDVIARTSSLAFTLPLCL